VWNSWKADAAGKSFLTIPWCTGFVESIPKIWSTTLNVAAAVEEDKPLLPAVRKVAAVAAVEPADLPDFADRSA
jgi:hypothetical protein